MMPDDSGTTGFDAAKLMTGGLALIGAAVGLVGAFTGVVPRLIRIHPNYFIAAIGLTLVAIGLGFWSSEVPQPAETEVKIEVDPGNGKPTTTTTTTSATGRVSGARLLLSLLSLAAFGGAALILILGLTSSLGTGDQPRLSASWTFPANRQPVLTVHLQLDNLKANQLVYVSVTPLGSPAASTIYRSQTGADVDGNADETFDVPLPLNVPGLQVVAAVDTATSCQGNPIPALVLPSNSNAAASNASVVANPTPTGQVTTPGILPPVKKAKQINFSCIQVTAPAPASTQSSK